MHKHSNNSGFTLLFAALILGSLMAVILAVTSIMTKQLVLSGMGRESQKAFYAANMGAECIQYLDSKLNYFYTDAEPAPPPGVVRKCGDLIINGSPVLTRVTDASICPSSGTPPVMHECFGGELSFSFFNGASPSPVEAPQVKVSILKDITSGKTTIESFGRNTGVLNLRRVERSARLTYYQSPRLACSTSGDIMVLVDKSSLTPNPSVRTSIVTLINKLFAPSVAGKDGGNKVGLIVYGATTPALTHLTSTASDLTSALPLSSSFGTNNPGGNLAAALRLARYELSGREVTINPSQLVPGDPTNLYSRDNTTNPNHIIVISGAVPQGSIESDGTFGAVGETSEAEADEAKKQASASIYTVAYGPAASNSAAKSFYDAGIAGGMHHLSNDSSLTNYPYSEKYSYIAASPKELELIVASVANCH